MSLNRSSERITFKHSCRKKKGEEEKNCLSCKEKTTKEYRICIIPLSSFHFTRFNNLSAQTHVLCDCVKLSKSLLSVRSTWH